MKNIYLKTMIVILVLLFTACDNKEEANSSIDSIASATQQVNFTLTTSKGEKIDIEKYDIMILSKQLEGKVVLINFWAPWCKPCIKEMPTFVELQEKYKDDFIVLGILFDKKSSQKEIDEFIIKHKINFPITIGEENNNIAKAFNDVQMVPESYLYAKDGIFIERFIGEVDKTKLEKYILKSIK
jgi:thiol-disulfide isomerase/thioredoxin